MRHSGTKLLKRSFLSLMTTTLLFCFAVASKSLLAQEPLPQYYASIPSSLNFAPDANFQELVVSRFKGFLIENYALERTTGLIALPTRSTPWDDTSEIAPGADHLDVGLLFAPTGSSRLDLAPGAYRVQVKREAETSWLAEFLDEEGETQSSRPAFVYSADKVDYPLAFVDYSICYRFDSVIVCV